MVQTKNVESSEIDLQADNELVITDSCKDEDEYMDEYILIGNQSLHFHNTKSVQDVYGPVVAKIKKGASIKIAESKPSKMYYPNLKNP